MSAGLIFEIVSSWQVIAVTIALVIFFFILNKVVNFKGGTKKPSAAPKPAKTKSAPVKVPEPSDNDDLGLEEE